MYGGMFYVTGAHYTYMNNVALGWIFMFFILGPNVLFFVYWINHMKLEVLKILYVKTPRIFKYITCGIYKGDEFERKFMTHETTENQN